MNKSKEKSTWSINNQTGNMLEILTIINFLSLLISWQYNKFWKIEVIKSQIDEYEIDDILCETTEYIYLMQCKRTGKSIHMFDVINKWYELYMEHKAKWKKAIRAILISDKFEQKISTLEHILGWSKWQSIKYFQSIINGNDTYGRKECFLEICRKTIWDYDRVTDANKENLLEFLQKWILIHNPATISDLAIDLKNYITVEWLGANNSYTSIIIYTLYGIIHNCRMNWISSIDESTIINALSELDIKIIRKATIIQEWETF